MKLSKWICMGDKLVFGKYCATVCTPKLWDINLLKCSDLASHLSDVVPMQQCANRRKYFEQDSCKSKTNAKPESYIMFSLVLRLISSCTTHIQTGKYMQWHRNELWTKKKKKHSSDSHRSIHNFMHYNGGPHIYQYHFCHIRKQWKSELMFFFLVFHFKLAMPAK